MKRIATDYPGVYYREITRIGSKGTDKVFYVVFKKDGKQIEAKAGSQYRHNMTAAKANAYRAALIDGKAQTPSEKRATEKAEKEAEANKWTLGRIFKEYMNTRPENSNKKIDQGRYDKYLKGIFDDKEPREIAALDVDRLRNKLSKTISPQSVKHILNLLTWALNYGVNNNLTSGLSFRIKKPTVHNEKTEFLTDEEIHALLTAAEKDPCVDAGAMIKLALCTGMRRGEMFKLKWDDVDFQRGFITLRAPKGGKDQTIPLNEQARILLENHPKPENESPYVFPGRKGKKRTDINHQVNRIKQAAGLPDDFRPLHGLRHAFASMLVNSKEVDLFRLQKLLTHKDPRMTQRYAHLRDDALKRAADVAGDIIDAIGKKKDEKQVVNLDGQGNRSR